jgi:hypothetical protein
VGGWVQGVCVCSWAHMDTCMLVTKAKNLDSILTLLLLMISLLFLIVMNKT